MLVSQQRFGIRSTSISRNYNSWTYHRKPHPASSVDEKNKDGIDDDVDHIDGADESKNEVEDRGKRPVKPAKRRLSEPKPICAINPNVKKVSPKTKKAKSTSASKEK